MNRGFLLTRRRGLNRLERLVDKTIFLAHCASYTALATLNTCWERPLAGCISDDQVYTAAKALGPYYAYQATNLAPVTCSIGAPG